VQSVSTWLALLFCPLQVKAQVNCVDDAIRSPLYIAVRRGHVSTAALLLNMVRARRGRCSSRPPLASAALLLALTVAPEYDGVAPPCSPIGTNPLPSQSANFEQVDANGVSILSLAAFHVRSLALEGV
jgi:hypothetical protein